MPSPENRATGPRRRTRRPAPRVDHTAFAGARAIAAWWVVFSHSADWLFSVIPELSWLAPLAHTGLAVEVFFVLSGYTVARAYLGRHWTWPAYGRYLRNRVARLYPAHVAVLLAFVLLCVGGAMVGVPTDDGAFPPIGLLAELTLTRAWFGDALWWNPPAWSLSAQFLAFILFPVLAVALRGRLRRPVPVLTLAVGLVSVTTIAAAVAPSAMNGMAPPALRVLCCFVLGIGVAEGTAALPVTRRAAWVAAGGAAGLVVAAIALEPGAPRAWAAITFAGIIVGGLAVASPRSTAVLRSHPARFLGQLSFSTYLVHVFVLILLAKAITPAAVGELPLLLRAPIVLAWSGSILAASWLLHTLVEVPWHRRLAAPRARRPAGADASTADGSDARA